MQAIILAAGMGRRLGELTKNNTKCMLEVNGVRLIDRYLRQLSKYSLDRIVIVVGYEGQKLIDYIHANYPDINIEFVNNPIYDKTNNIYSLALAKDYLCADDTILMESDLIVEDGIIDELLNHTDKDLALVAKYEQWMDGTMVRIDDNRRILQFIPKAGFRYEEADDYYKTVNIYKFSREFSSKQYIPFLEAYCKVMGNNEYYEQVLSVLTLLQNTTLRALPIGNEKWYEIDDVQDLDIASTLFSEDKNRFQPITSDMEDSGDSPSCSTSAILSTLSSQTSACAMRYATTSTHCLRAILRAWVSTRYLLASTLASSKTM